ncbi:hypothetical protein J14TS2_45130 [Bacillus sp. J14TS2]|uniref:hypothetical protein n=1 Tax=Bacillus sp. J14TS2 TaxID=2807188 RepID=UPI001B0E910C|nr:hypothetical protein [Bacillus sp. J14TS2]GIN74038.1 hypothetical protein J14TS2_45130 [Bacillus sp. J14TS2]
MLYIFDQDDKFQNIITPDTGLIDTWFKDYQNHLIDEPFVFHIESSSELLPLIIEENQVAFSDRDNRLRLMRIKEIYETSTNHQEYIVTAKCEPSYLELYDHFIEDRRITDGTAQTALNRALEGSRYIGEVTVDLGLASDNFYWTNGIDGVFKIINTWGGALVDTITLDEDNEIIERKIIIQQRLGADNGLIVEPDYNAERIERKTLSYPITAMWGQGASLEIEDENGEATGGHTRYITFEDVEWKVSKGDPVDKPKGQKWVGDPQALHDYGYLHEGKLLHRFGHFSNQEYETPEELLMATWQALQEQTSPEISHESTINVDRPVSLGDTVTILDRNYNKPIELQSQITGLEYDVLDIDKDVLIIVGKYVDMNQNPLERDIEDLKEAVNKPRPIGPITNDRFPDIKPGIPSNVEATGAFQTIQLFWDYSSEVYISHYEVYGSQVKDFVPDTQHLLWRGRVSSFAHEVDTDQTWYYRVRAVNTRGTASDYGPQVSASTVRIISDDILFGEIIADHLEDNLDIADKLAQNTVDRINKGPMEEIVYTQQQIEATEERLSKELNSRIGDVSANIDGLYDVADDLKARADETDQLLAEYGGKFTSIETDIDEIEGSISATITSVERIDNTVNSHSATLSAQADLIAAKVDDLTYKKDKDGLIESIEANSLELSLLAEGLELTVTRKEFEALEISGRNLARGTSSNLTTRIIGQYGASNLLKVPIDGKLVSHGDQVTFSIYVQDIPEGETVYPRLDWYRDDGTYTNDVNQAGRISSNGRIQITATIPNDKSFTEIRGRIMPISWTSSYTVKTKEEQLERGNKMTGWSQAPEDIEKEFTTIRGRVATTEATLKVHADQIVAKVERNQVYIKSEVDTALGKKVDFNVYEGKVSGITTDLNSVKTRVSSTETKINGLTGEMSSALSQIASLDVKANGIVQNVSEIRKDLDNVDIISFDGGSKKFENITARSFGSSSVTGALVIKTPITSSYMTRVSITGYNYVSKNSDIDLTISFYAYTSNTFHQHSFKSVGNYPVNKVRLARENGRTVIIIEDVGSKWAYPKISVDSAIIGHNAPPESYKNGWDILIENNISKYTNTVNISGKDVQESITKAEGSIKTLAGEVELRASEISLVDNRLKAAESTINLLPNEIDLKVTQGLGALQIGGTNLSPNSDKLDGHWNAYQGSKITYSKVDMTEEWGFKEAYRIKSSGGTEYIKGVWTSTNKIEPMTFNDTYTYSLYVKNMGNYPVRIHLNGLSPGGGSQATELQKNESKRVVMSGVRRKDYDWFQSILRVTDVSHTIDVIVGREQVEKGSKASDWSPAVEDMVGVDNVLASINLSKEGVRIVGDKIHLSGQSLIDDAVIGTAAIANLSVTNGKIAKLAVDTGQIQNLAVTTGKIANLAVDDAKIANVSVTKLKAGEIDTSIIKIRGGSSTDYSLIDGSTMELRGRYNRAWQGSTTTHDVRTRLQNGHLRFRNDSLGRSLYMSEFGISTYLDGEGESGGSSGTISWWDKTYSTTGANGLTINSHGGVVALESDKNIVAINPFKDDSNSKFWFTRSNDYNDGYLSFGSNLGAPSMALRFFNGKTELAMVDSNYQRGGNTTFDVGNLKVNTIRKRDGSGGVYWNGSSGGTTTGGNLDNTLFATGIRSNDSNIYLATDNGGTVHITDYAGYNSGKGITYRDLYARQIFANTMQFNADAGGTHLYLKPSASGEVKITAPNTTDIYRPLKTSKLYETSSEKYKRDIKIFEDSALDMINKSIIYDYEKDGSYGREIGFIIEREMPELLVEGDAIDGYSHRSLNTKAIQELDVKLDTKFYDLESRLDEKDLEIQYLRQKITQLEEKVA